MGSDGPPHSPRGTYGRALAALKWMRRSTTRRRPPHRCAATARAVTTAGAGYGELMHWRIKGAIQTVLGHVPGGTRMHYLLQRTGGGLADFGGECDSKLDDWRIMM